MIIAKQKPLREIYRVVQGHGRVLVLGCDTCVAVCHSGGSKEAEILASLLRLLAIQEGRQMEITHSGVGRQCEEREEFFSLQEAVDWADAVVSTACGAGVQFMAEKYPGKPVYPGVDTVILGGATERPGLWTEKCQGCGECVLARTGGICPVSRCAKRLFNGPCGGSTQGKCEISPEVDCAWQLIIDRLKALGRMDLFEEPAPLKDWAADRAGGPRSVLREEASREAGSKEGFFNLINPYPTHFRKGTEWSGNRYQRSLPRSGAPGRIPPAPALPLHRGCAAWAAPGRRPP